MGDNASASKLYSGGLAAVIDIIIIAIITAIAASSGDPITTAVGFFFGVIIVLALSIRVLNEWNRMAVLRLGKYVGVIGPGFYLIMPIIESTPITLDIRVISTPFSAEKTFTFI